MNFLFPVDAIALNLKYRIDNFLVASGNPNMVANITVNKCRLLAMAITLMELRHWFSWYPCEEKEHKLERSFGRFPREFIDVGHIEGALARLMPGYELTVGHPSLQLGEFFNQLDNQVLDPVAGDVNLIMERMMKEPTWNICAIKQIGNNLMLEFSGDYRIWDWHNTRSNVRHPWNSHH